MGLICRTRPYPRPNLIYTGTSSGASPAQTSRGTGGVAAFAARGVEQTIPVSHFGDISRSPLWLILNNPKGDRHDAAVGTVPRSFGAPDRSTLGSAAIASVKTHFDRYFQPGVRINEFFGPWIALLDGILLDGGF